MFTILYKTVTKHKTRSIFFVIIFISVNLRTSFSAKKQGKRFKLTFEIIQIKMLKYLFQKKR